MNPERTITLALAGGNALGAYGAGACEALIARSYVPAMISGASIGAVTGAIIAGNPPEQRLPRLREFWEQAGLTSAPGVAPAGGYARALYNRFPALQRVMTGRQILPSYSAGSSHS